MQIWDTEQLNDYVFSRLRNHSCWVILESHDLGIMTAFVKYLFSKEDLREDLTTENIRIFITGPELPLVFVLNKTLVPKEVIATFIEAAGDKPHADVVRNANGDQDIFVFASASDTSMMSMAIGMAEHYAKWKATHQ
jgi:hypothetical protein